jgi:hypothetical protein
VIHFIDTPHVIVDWRERQRARHRTERRTAILRAVMWFAAGFAFAFALFFGTQHAVAPSNYTPLRGDYGAF